MRMAKSCIRLTPARAKALRRAYRLMRAHFGHLHWWPGETPFEVCVGAILTQNTSWSNVERAIANLKAARVLEPGKLFALSASELAALIRPAAALVPAGAGRGIRRGPGAAVCRGDDRRARAPAGHQRRRTGDGGQSVAVCGRAPTVRDRRLHEAHFPAARVERRGRRLRGLAAVVRMGVGREAPPGAAGLLAGLPCATGHGREGLLPHAPAALRGVPAETSVAAENPGRRIRALPPRSENSPTVTDREPSPARSAFDCAGSGPEVRSPFRIGGRCEPGTARGPGAVSGCARPGRGGWSATFGRVGCLKRFKKSRLFSSPRSLICPRASII